MGNEDPWVQYQYIYIYIYTYTYTKLVSHRLEVGRGIHQVEVPDVEKGRPLATRAGLVHEDPIALSS